MPTMVRMYNSSMGGVDLADQRKETYEIDHRSKYKYYLRLLFDFLDIAISNAYIIHNKLENTKLSSKDFRLLIVRGLVGQFSSRQHSGHYCGQGKKRKLNAYCQTPLHMPVFVQERKRCAHCSTKQNDCRSNIKCTTCSLMLCLNAKRNCFHEYHSQLNNC